MTLNSERLRAFHQLAIDRNYHKAAEHLCLSQSAISQRILKLEEELGEPLVIRDSQGIRLTEAGKVLFDHVCNLMNLEQDMLAQLSGSQPLAQGCLRVAAYSSVLRSVVIPSLAKLIRGTRNSRIEFFSREMSELPAMLKSGEADFIVLDYALENSELVRYPLGRETLIHIRHRDDRDEDNAFLDHDAEDMTTYQFFLRQQQEDRSLKRSYYDDIYGIIDGVRLGLGQAIVSRHLIRDYPEIRTLPQAHATSNPVFLYHNRNRQLSQLQQRAIEALREQAPVFLDRH